MKGWDHMCYTYGIDLHLYMYPLAMRYERDGYVTLLLRVKKRKGTLYVASMESNILHYLGGGSYYSQLITLSTHEYMYNLDYLIFEENVSEHFPKYISYPGRTKFRLRSWADKPPAKMFNLNLIVDFEE